MGVVLVCVRQSGVQRMVKVRCVVMVIVMMIVMMMTTIMVILDGDGDSGRTAG